eukprot:6736401-Prymnesium_polylepis.1
MDAIASLFAVSARIVGWRAGAVPTDQSPCTLASDASTSLTRVPRRIWPLRVHCRDPQEAKLDRTVRGARSA